MIELNEEYLLYQGGYRNIYQHPEYEGRCIKVLNQEALSKARARKRRYEDENSRDRRAYEILEENVGQVYTQHIPQYYSMLETSLGLGLSMQLIRDRDGNPSKNLQQFLLDDPSAVSNPLLQQALHDLFSFLHKNAIVTRKYQTFNLTVQVLGSDFKIWLIDGLGNSDFLPLTSWFEVFAKRKVLRQIKVFKQRNQKLTNHHN